MASDILERIFDPFFTTKEAGVGTGLGLSLVHSTVSQLGGAVDVSTALGVGSVFTVYLPHSGHAADAVETSIAELPTGNGQRIIVIDDEGALARLTAENLVSLGYSTIWFASSLEALHSIQAHPEEFDLLITDERMPGMSGSALIEEVRQLRRDVPIIVVSGNLSPDLVTRVRQAGANDVLKKPVLRLDLALIVARALEATGSRGRLDDVRPNV
jgi:CheY-like chemotaxis protein